MNSKDIEILAIIPARGGSKGIPRKNLKMLAGRPLIEWSIKTGLGCPSIDRLIVSTDDVEIASIAEKNGAEIPFLQPKRLAQDDIPDYPVANFAVKWLQEKEAYQPDLLVWLRPTSPLRRINDVESAIEELISSNADCIRSVSRVKHHPYWMKQMKEDRLIPYHEDKNEKLFPQRQYLPPLYYLNGAVDVTWVSNILKSGFLFGGYMRAYLMDSEYSLDLDTEFDFMMAEMLLEKRNCYE